MTLIKYLASIGFLLVANSAEEYAQRQYERECPCTPSKLWLDIVVAIDTSAGMTGEGVTQVIADVATVFEEATIAQGEGHHTRIGVITYAENATTRYKVTDFQSSDEFHERIWEVKAGEETYSNLKEGLMVAQENLKEAREAKLRQNVKEVIIIYASDFKEEDEHDVKQLADQIKISGTDIIVVGFDQGGRLKALERMKRIASPGYFFRNTAVDLAGEIQHSLCQTNCFCKRQWKQYSGSTVKFGSCLKIGGIAANWKSAKRACQRMGNGRGHLASEFDISKHNFIALMFKDDYRMEQPYMYHIGLSYDEERKDYFWEQPYGKKVSIEASDFRKWNKGSPNNEMGACVIAAQASSSFDLGWQSVDCSKKAIRYMCQTESCDTDSYCENVE